MKKIKALVRDGIIMYLKSSLIILFILVSAQSMQAEWLLYSEDDDSSIYIADEIEDGVISGEYILWVKTYWLKPYVNYDGKYLQHPGIYSQ